MEQTRKYILVTRKVEYKQLCSFMDVICKPYRFPKSNQNSLLADEPYS